MQPQASLPLRWRRVYLRGIRQSLVHTGPLRCPACSAEAPNGAHPLDWLSLIEYPALIPHGVPGEERHFMYISGYCGYCYYGLLFSAGGEWVEDHPDLTRATDQEQDAADPNWPEAWK